ncbi:apolipoprotein N-acyltransferase [Chachezhania sediminis]|uniref:apolipoprotein N-acyltransferase n=1 Tax=Chachezhania sediminis TaxID=2599291 RepID=UPI00131B1199|nr:apolipoprotein N-acyltransferase [Chachezhania sediminis]
MTDGPKLRHGRRRLALLAGGLILGALGALGLAPLYLWPATVIMLLGVAFAFDRCRTAGQAALFGLALGGGWFGIGLSWIVEPFFVDAALTGWLAPFGIFFMAGGMALFWAAAFWIAFRMGRTLNARIWALCLTWTLTGLARGYILTGFPWAGPSQIWVDSAPALLLAWIGPYGLTLATFAAVLPLGVFLLGLLQRRPDLKMALPACAGAAAVAAAVLTAPEVTMTGQTVRVVQPNAQQDLKWDPLFRDIFFDRQIDFTAAEGETGRPDLIVWPETALLALLDRAQSDLARMAGAAAGVPLAFGAVRDQFAEDGVRYYNTLAVMDDAGDVTELYDKHHLVPFGEYLPFRGLMSRIGLRGLAENMGSGYSSGPGPALIDLGPAGQAVPLICYEAVFPQDVGGAPGRADLLLQVTNDAWFGSRSGPYQHLAQARMRAVEQGLPMVRAANTGVSAMIDPLGRILAQIPLNEAGFFDAALPAPLPPTLYARSGDWPVFLGALGLVLMWMMRILGRKRRT